ncbi:hypothetical protein PHMEG_00025760, partial [Phytophthora megakarya]
EAGELTEYHQRLVKTVKISHKCAEIARRREQQREARYYVRKVRNKRKFKIGDHMGLFRPPRGPKATKSVHSWIGPLRIVADAGYENYLLQFEDGDGAQEQVIAPIHAFWVNDIDGELQHENEDEVEWCESQATRRKVDRPTTAPVCATADGRTAKRSRSTMGSAEAGQRVRPQLVEVRRRRRRNNAGQYAFEYELRPVYRGECEGAANDDQRWVTIAEYDRLFNEGQGLEGLEFGEGV